MAGIVSGCFYLGCGIGPLAGGSLTDLTGDVHTLQLLCLGCLNIMSLM